MPRTRQRNAVIRLALIFALILAVSPAGLARGWPGANDNLFPSAPEAKSAIDFDAHGFLIHGQRTFIVAGALHYSRVPRALWRDRLLRIKRAGYNAVQTYVFWNYHEMQEGHYDFSGDKDLDAYLKLIHALGMYAVIRLGPYINAEWDSGGWPVWLRFKPGLIVREDNGPFLNALDPWLDHLMPIIASNQINHGGSVILVQLENEDTRGAGTDVPNAYFKHLQDKCVSLGLQVPYFFSGLNHNDDPADTNPVDMPPRTTPWYSSEFWTGWINFYNTDPGRELKLIRSTWRVVAYGGNGYSHYTMAGGTNFDNWACGEQGTNYDFGAPIGQTGDFRDVYYGLKCAAMFATSFPLVLENSHDDTSAHRSDVPGVRVTARTGPSGTILFLDNAGGSAVATQIKSLDRKTCPDAGLLHVQPGEIMPVVEGGYPIAPGVAIECAAARILTLVPEEHRETLVVYGPAGDPAEIQFSVPRSGVTIAAKQGWTQTPGHVVLATTYPPDGVQSFSFRAGQQTIRVIAEDTDMAERTWQVTVGGKPALVCGPDYVGEVTDHHGRPVIDAERRSPKLTQGPTDAYLIAGDAAPIALRDLDAVQTAAAPTIPALGSWSVAPGDQEAQLRFFDANWRASREPEAMGADGSSSAYAWYRTTLHALATGSYALSFSDAGDWLSVFVNGVHAASSDIQTRYDHPVARTLSVTLQAGDNAVAVLAAHYGRGKLHAYVGPLDTLDAKGINGPVRVTGNGMNEEVQVWKMQGGITWPGENDAAWKPLSADAGGGPKFYKSVFTVPTLSATGPQPALRVHPDGLSRGFFLLNGHNIGRYPDKATITDLYLPPCWLQIGKNTLLAFDEDGNSPSHVQIVEETAASRVAMHLSPVPESPANATATRKE